MGCRRTSVFVTHSLRWLGFGEFLSPVSHRPYPSCSRFDGGPSSMRPGVGFRVDSRWWSRVRGVEFLVVRKGGGWFSFGFGCPEDGDRETRSEDVGD